MGGWYTAVCNLNGVNIHYTRTGGDRQPLVLLHGLMTNGLCWTGLARALEKEYDVIMPDARGHGNSSVPTFGYQYEDHAKDVEEFMQALQLPRPIVLGHSMGGMTAALVASRKQYLLQGLVLAEPTFLSPSALRAVRDSDVAEQHRHMLHMPLKEVMADARNRHPKRSEETIALLARARLQTSMAAFDVLTPSSPDYKAVVREIGIPSLLVFGEGGVVSADVAQEVRRLNPRFQAEQIREAGHSVHLDQPERFASVVQVFLRSMGAGAS